MNKVLVIGGDVVSRVEAYNQLVDEHSVVGVGDVRSAGGMLDWADVVVLLDATNDEAHALPRSYRGRAVLVTSYPELFMQSAELGYLGADRNNDQLASLVALALERITSPKSRVVV